MNFLWQNQGYALYGPRRGEEKIESHQPQHAKKKERRERKQSKDSGERSISRTEKGLNGRIRSKEIKQEEGCAEVDGSWRSFTDLSPPEGKGRRKYQTRREGHPWS